MIRNLYNNGCTIYEISKSLNLTEETIKKKMSQMNLYERKIYKRLDSDFEKTEIIKHLRMGYSLDKIGDILGMSATTISNRVREYNINVQEEKEYYKEYLKKEIEKLSDQGLSRTQIALQLDITPEYIEKLIGKRVIDNEKSIRQARIEHDGERIIKLLQNGYTLVAICEELNISKRTLASRIQKNNIDVEKEKSVYTQKVKCDIMELLEQGYSNDEIAKQLGMAVTTIISIVGDDMIDYYKKQREDEEKEKIIKYIQEGYILTSVAQLMGMTTVTLKNKIKKYNIDIPKRYYRNKE